MRLIAAIEDPIVVRKILSHLGVVRCVVTEARRATYSAIETNTPFEVLICSKK